MEGFESAEGKPPRESVARGKYLVLGGQEETSDSSVNSELVDESMWRSVDPAGGGVRGDLEATWFTNTSREGLGQGRLGLRDSVEARELQRIFSVQVIQERSCQHKLRRFVAPAGDAVIIAKLVGRQSCTPRREASS